MVWESETDGNPSVDAERVEQTKDLTEPITRKPYSDYPVAQGKFGESGGCLTNSAGQRSEFVADRKENSERKRTGSSRKQLLT